MTDVVVAVFGLSAKHFFVPFDRWTYMVDERAEFQVEQYSRFEMEDIIVLI